MSGAPLIAEEDDPVHESALDWSVSGISSVSEFDPNQFTRENAPTPDLTSIGRDEIDQLVDNVRDIRNSLASISEKTATPTNSPRTENNTVIRNISTGHTPPVKDVGLDSDVGKLEHMRRMLRDLENSRQTVASRRSLKFGSDKSNDDVLKQMNEILERSKTSKNELLEQEKKRNFELEKEVGTCKEHFEYEKRRNSELENEVIALNAQLKLQAQEFQNLKTDAMQKGKIILDLKSRWSGVVQEFNEKLTQTLDEKEKFEKAYSKLKSDQNEAQHQLTTCQNELEKAITLALEFKQKIDADEEIKSGLENEMIKQSNASSNELEQLKKDKTELKHQIGLIQKQLEQVIEEKQNYEKIMARERDQFERGQDHWKSQYEQLKIETNAKLKANEESLHAFYLNQMEQIFDEKVKGIQKHVDTWEKQLLKEKNDALVSLEGQHNQQIESFKRQFSQLEAQIMASEAIHIASKKEAVALKGQLEQGPRSLRTTCRTPSTSASENDEVGLTSRRSLPNNNNLNNRKGSRKLSTSRMTSVTSVLQLKNDLKDEVRPRSAGPNLGSTSKTK